MEAKWANEMTQLHKWAANSIGDSLATAWPLSTGPQLVSAVASSSCEGRPLGRRREKVVQMETDTLSGTGQMPAQDGHWCTRVADWPADWPLLRMVPLAALATEFK